MKKASLICAAFCCLVNVYAQNEWTQLTPTGDVPSEREGMVMVTIGNAIYLFGGYNISESNMNDLYRFNPSMGSWEELSPANASPEARSGHKAVAFDAKMYVFFGSGAEGFLNDIWQYDPLTNLWTEIVPVSQTNPGARAYNSILLIGNMAWFFGGINDSGEVLSDLWAFNFSNSQWESYPSYSGPGRHGHIAARKDSEMYIIGGYEEFNAVNSVICYHTGSGTWSTLSKKGSAPEPFAYAGHSQVDNQVFIFGGATNTDVTGNAYSWDLNEMNFTPLADGPVRSDPGVARVPGSSLDKDIEYQSFMLFGGSNMGVIEDETWYYISDIIIQSGVESNQSQKIRAFYYSENQTIEILIPETVLKSSSITFNLTDASGQLVSKGVLDGTNKTINIPENYSGMIIVSILQNNLLVLKRKIIVTD